MLSFLKANQIAQLTFHRTIEICVIKVKVKFKIGTSANTFRKKGFPLIADFFRCW